MKGIWEPQSYSFDNNSSQCRPATRVFDKLYNFVDQIVFAAINKSQVVQRIICWIIVNVVHMFIGCQRVTKMLCHYNAMLENPAAPAFIMPDLLIEIPMLPNTHSPNRKDTPCSLLRFVYFLMYFFSGKWHTLIPFKQISFGFLERSPRQTSRDFSSNINVQSLTIPRAIFMITRDTAGANSLNRRATIHACIRWLTLLFTPYLFACTRAASYRSTVTQLLSTIQTVWQSHKNLQVYRRFNCNLKHRTCQEVVA